MFESSVIPSGSQTGGAGGQLVGAFESSVIPSSSKPSIQQSDEADRFESSVDLAPGLSLRLRVVWF